MAEDIVPVLLQNILNQFEEARLSSEKLKQLSKKLIEKKSSYLDANDYAIELGDILSTVFGDVLSDTALPDGKMHYNIARRLLDKTLGRNYELVSQYTGAVQRRLNEQAQISVAVQVPAINQNRIDGLVNRLSSGDNFDSVQWLVSEPIVNFTQSIVDDFIQKNAEFHQTAGLHPTIERRAFGHCCDWCQSLAGRYLYGDEPKNFYRRHQRCRCTIDYDPKNGKIQNSWSKKYHTKMNSKREILKQQEKDIEDNLKADDKREFRYIKAILGRENGPISLAQFQEMKYNNSEKYERLMDEVFITEKFKSGRWLDKINIEKQAKHMRSAMREDKSYFYDGVDVQALYDKYKMTGTLEKSKNGTRGRREKIDLPSTEKLGVDVYTGREINAITIHYSRTGVHLVPTYYQQSEG